MYYLDNRKHKLPHIHVKHQGDEVVVSIPDGSVLEGWIPGAKMRMVQVWIAQHESELMVDWHLSVCGERPLKIEGLKL